MSVLFICNKRFCFRILCLVAIGIQWIQGTNSADYRYAAPCPTAPEVYGYTSLVELDLEMRRHDSLLYEPLYQPPLDNYTYTLCPDTVFNGIERLTPSPGLLQYSPVIQCSETGQSANKCTIYGGTTQVMLIQRPLDGNNDTSINLSVTFQGITFQNSQNVSIAAMASPNMRAIFMDCHWIQCRGMAAVVVVEATPAFQAYGHPEYYISIDDIFLKQRQRMLEISSTPQKEAMTVFMSHCSFTDDLLSSQDYAISNSFVLIDNYGGRLELEDTTVTGINGSMIANVVQGGSLTLKDSFIGPTTSTIATIRSLGSLSHVEIINSTFLGNGGTSCIAILAAMEESTLIVDSSRLGENQVQLGQIVAFAASEAVVSDTCLASNDAILLDASSSLMHDGELLFFDEATECSNSDDSSVQVWRIESDWTCLNGNGDVFCPGKCMTVTTGVCSLPESTVVDSLENDSFTNADTPSSATKQWRLGSSGTLLLLCFLYIFT